MEVSKMLQKYMVIKFMDGGSRGTMETQSIYNNSMTNFIT
jgi:hypothetical protein